MDQPQLRCTDFLPWTWPASLACEKEKKEKNKENNEIVKKRFNYFRDARLTRESREVWALLLLFSSGDHRSSKTLEMPYMNQRILALVQILRAFVNQQNATLTARLLPSGNTDYLYPSDSWIFFSDDYCISQFSGGKRQGWGGWWGWAPGRSIQRDQPLKLNPHAIVDM